MPWHHSTTADFTKLKRSSATAEIVCISGHYAIQGHEFGTNQKTVCSFLFTSCSSIGQIAIFDRGWLPLF